MADPPRQPPEPPGSGGADPPQAAALPPPDIGLPDRLAGSGALDRLVETARGYAAQSAAAATRRAYAADWARFARWARRRGAALLPPDPQLVGLYVADCAAGGPSPALSVASIERTLSGLAAGYRARGFPLDRSDRHIAQVLAGVRRVHGAPPRRKAAVSAEEILAMAATLAFDLRGLRDRALLLLGFAAGTRRSELVGLDCARGDTPEGRGWVEIEAGGVLLTLRGKTGWREIAVGRGSSERSCPVRALETWLAFGRIDLGPVFRRVSPDGTRALDARLSDRHVARLVKRTVLAAGLRPDLPEAERLALYSGHSLRAGLASHAEAPEAAVQTHLGHASAEMTRRYQRKRDRYRLNLTKAAGL
jgi:integrase